MVYGLAIVISRVTRRLIKTRKRHGRIIVNGTFHNPNWFHAHVTPLVNSGYGEVVLVCDESVAELPGLTYRCPPIMVQRILSRAGAKALYTLIEGFRRPADIFIGYHIFPSAITALICARLLGAKCIYQVTSGPLELEGGGWHAENQVLVALGGPSRFIERLALAVTREFDVAIVRGSRARSYLLENGFKNRLEIVTGSVKTNFPVSDDKKIDIIFVGRLTEYKRPDRLIEVVRDVAAQIPDCRTVLVGSGPDQPQLEAKVAELGLEQQIEFLGQRSDVPDLVSQAKIFVLTSRWEGVSIAMLEAMAMEAVPVVSDVGDLADFAQNDVTGWVFGEDDQSGFATAIIRLLTDEDLRLRMGKAARQLVVANCDAEVLAKRWGQIFIEVGSPSP